MFKSDLAIRIVGGINGETMKKFELRLVEVLKKIKPEDTIDIYITSGGGSTTMGRVFFDILQSIDQRIRTIGVGEVYSTAALMLQAGNERLITPRTLMLLHPQKWWSPDHSKIFTLDELDLIIKKMHYDDEIINDIFVKRSNIDFNTIVEMRKTQTLLYPKDIIKLGFADGIFD